MDICATQVFNQSINQSNLVNEDGATESPLASGPVSRRQGAVFCHNHHVHLDSLPFRTLHSQAKVQTIASVAFHYHQHPSCHSDDKTIFFLLVLRMPIKKYGTEMN
jgi:hypothetical protein